jgi:hypothetical protein
MRFIPTRIHGILDYFVGILLIAAPWLFNFYLAGAEETWVPVIVGIMVLLQAILTDFEVGLVRKLPMKTHLSMDLLMGLFLALSPWLFGFADLVAWPHVLFGVFSILASLTTHTTPAGYEGYTVFDSQNDDL